MKNKEYLESLSFEELLNLELEVLKATRNPADNIYLKEVNDEFKYRLFKNDYYAFKEGTHKEQDSFIDTNSIDLLALYDAFRSEELDDYLDKFSKSELEVSKKALIDNYKIYNGDNMIKKIDESIIQKEREEKYLKIKKLLPATLMEYYNKQELTDYLKTLTDEELQNAEMFVSTTDMTGNNEKLYVFISQEKEYRAFKKNYEKLKSGEKEDKCKFLDNNLVDLLGIYRSYQYGKLDSYLEKYSPKELKEIEKELVENYNFLKIDPIISIIKDKYKNKGEIKEEDIDKYSIKTLSNYYQKGVLAEYLKTLTDEELNNAHMRLTIDDVFRDLAAIFEIIINEIDCRNSDIESKTK